jgi:hypothetical protein
MIAVQCFLVTGILALIVTVAVAVGIIIDHLHFNRIDRQLGSIERLIDSSESIIRAVR